LQYHEFLLNIGVKLYHEFLLNFTFLHSTLVLPCPVSEDHIGIYASCSFRTKIKTLEDHILINFNSQIGNSTLLYNFSFLEEKKQYSFILLWIDYIEDNIKFNIA